MQSLTERKAQLEARLKALDWKLVEVETELDAPMNPDASERAVEREGDEVLEKLGLNGAQEIAMIQSALDRIAAGMYGHCAKCGEAISEARLDVLPHTPLCRNCACG